MNWSHIHLVAGVPDLSSDLVKHWQGMNEGCADVEVGPVAKALSRARYRRQTGYAFIVIGLVLVVWLAVAPLPGPWAMLGWCLLVLAAAAAAVSLVARADRTIGAYLWEGERVCWFVDWVLVVVKNLGLDPPDQALLREMLSWAREDLRTHARNHLTDLATRQLIPEQWVGGGEAPTLVTALQCLQGLGLVAPTDTPEKFLAIAKEKLDRMGVG